jgi:pimeloyl-ACP methyl ester carboxylesterase
MVRASSALLSALLASMFTTAAAEDEPISLSSPWGESHGSMQLPISNDSRTVVLIIAGSGPTDRDGNGPTTKNDSLKLLAQSLAQGGIASVRYDKRGVGRSASAPVRESETTFGDLVEDAKAWVRHLSADNRFAHVIVIGHSEGATIGMLAAQLETVDGYVSIAGPSQRASVGLRSQLRGKLPPALAGRSEEILVALESGVPVSEIPQPLLALFRPSVQPYLIDWFKIVPTDEIGKVAAPILLLQGDADLQIPVTAAHALHAASPRSELAIIEGMNHVLKIVPLDQASQMASYRDASLPIAPALTERLLQFIRTRIAR